MNKNNFFETHLPKLRLEAIVKSVLCGLAVGFGANFVAATVTWFLPIAGLWLSVGVFTAASVLSGLLFYFKVFRPTDTRNARRLDRMGLYERMVTMVEYENDDSFMARVQRADAQRVLSSVDKKQIKIKISKVIAVSAIAFSVLGLGMTTVSALSDYGVIPGGDELVGSLFDEATKVSYEVIYTVADENCGQIIGDAKQLIREGESGEVVIALANDGYIFKRWSDGSTNPIRAEENVTEDATYVAEFISLEEESNFGDNSEESDEDDSVPKNQNGSGDPEAEGGDPSDSIEGTGKYKPNNQILDGKKYYRDYYKENMEEILERLSDESNDWTEAERELIKLYLGIV